MAAKKIFSIEEALIFGWEVFKKNARFLILVFLFVMGINIIFEEIADQTKGSFLLIHFSAKIIFYLINIIIEIGLITIFLKIYNKKNPKFKNLFLVKSETFLDILVGGIIYTLIFIAGLIFFVVPGIIWSIKYIFYSFLIVDKKLNAFEALKKSAEITMGHKGQLFLFGLAIIAINLLGLMAFGVGLLISAPVTLLASIFVYHKLSAGKI